MNNKGVSGKIVWLIVGIVIIAVVAIYFTFFFSYKCGDLACFKSHQADCAKTKFTKNAEDAIWAYHIKGKSGGECKINVKLLKVKEGKTDLKLLEGNSMTCYLPLGNTADPETDITKCHGLLKEELQAMIINRLHAHILDNLGEIDEELKKVV